MKALKAEMARLEGRFNALSRRERGMIAAAVIGGFVFVGNSFFIDPDLVRARNSARLLQQQQTELMTVDAQILTLKQQLSADPDAEAKARLLLLNQQLTSVDASLKEIEGGLVPPEKMPALLERLLARNANLRMVSFRSMPPVSLSEQARAAKAAATPGSVPSVTSEESGSLYRHGIELKLEGTYGDLYGWLSQLESSPQKILWGDIRFSVIEHPRSTMSITVFTLSSDKAWLAI